MPPDERDACGVGFVADLSGRASHRLLRDALTAVANMQHRGALAADAKTGDGAGVLTQIPFAPFRRDLRLPAGNANLAVGMLFLPADEAARDHARVLVEATAEGADLRALGWRDVPTDPGALGPHAKSTQPFVAQIILGRGPGRSDAEFDRILYRCRRQLERQAAEAALAVYVASLSRRTIVYKGLFSSPQLPRFYPDLAHPSYETALAVIHQRYSTNTFPSWHLAQPFRYLAHNGEINTLQGNMLWMQAREAALSSRLWGGRVDDLRPVIQSAGSDSGMLDNTLELLATSGRDLPHAMLMLVPEAWEENAELDETVRDFYAYHACLTEPWDGPAALVFSDDSLVGAALDRNGLRPARYCRADDGRVVMASEAGVLDLAPEHIIEKGRLGPGQMILADLSRGVFVGNREFKLRYARRKPYGRWLRRHLVSLGHAAVQGTLEQTSPLVARQRAAGYTLEDVERILHPMAEDGKDPAEDVDARDSAAKLAILVSAAFNVGLRGGDVFREGIERITLKDLGYARELGFTIKLLAIGRNGDEEIEARVHPALLPLDHPLAKVTDEFNAVHVESEGLGPVVFTGRGAGGAPTAVAVVGDVIDVARNLRLGVGGRSRPAAQRPARVRPMEDVVLPYYLSLQLTDRPGVFARVATAFGEEQVSIASIVQKSRGEVADAVFVTHDAPERSMRRVLARLETMDEVKAVNNAIRVAGSV